MLQKHLNTIHATNFILHVSDILCLFKSRFLQ